MGDLDPYLTRFLEPIRSHNPNGISIGSAAFAGLTSVTDRPTDHATRAVTIVVYIQAMRPNNNTNDNVYGAVIMTEPTRPER